ncbi:hypothetical protein AMECASPLE_033918 [Ameca splendens]|uniref:Uncharacterized protein n=1 Tax=Ameca splendens TaxID=208324 RepID=A0ABV0YI59_9TELE
MLPELLVPERNRYNLLSTHQEELKEAGQSALLCLSVLPMWLVLSPGSFPENLPDQVQATRKNLLIRLKLTAPRDLKPVDQPLANPAHPPTNLSGTNLNKAHSR